MLAMEGALTRGYAQLALHVRIDLLDPEPLSPFASKGQRSVLLWILLSSCLSLFWFGGDPAVINAFVLALALGVAASAFALPLSRVRARIVAARRAEIGRVNGLLRSGLFVLIGIGSWLGGALVERILEAVLPH